MQSNTAAAEVPARSSCSKCGTVLGGSVDRVATPSGDYCRPCHNNLQSEQVRAAEDQGRDINYLMGLVGALLGATLGVVAWWAVTVWTNTAFGLVAILIGLAVGKGTTLLAGNKRSRSLQVISISVAACAYLYASFLVNRTFLQQAMAQDGKQIAISLLPDPPTLFSIATLGFDFMSLLFLAIVLWEAWKIPGPAKMS